MFRTILLAQAAGDAEPKFVEVAQQFSEVLIPILLATVFLVVILVGGLMLYFRKGDKEVNARLRNARTAGVQFPGPDEPVNEETPPAEETSAAPPPSVP
jgi:hypothetical protein